jgi:hypothetical protein
VHLVAIFDRPLLSRTGHDTWPRKREAVHHHGAGQSYAMVDEIHGFKSFTTSELGEQKQRRVDSLMRHRINAHGVSGVVPRQPHLIGDWHPVRGEPLVSTMIEIAHFR